ncbi:MAG: DUF1385 domain-containing protein [Ruminococcaceae bacterium]|nr:DUF1385 domain-containing protein [Oscillospiraceae bacterium]
MAKNEPQNCRLNRVGGAAVLEGVMMKAGDRASTACRLEDGKIAVVDKKFVSARKKHKFLNIPILRGVVNFVESLILSFSTLELSAEMMGEALVEEESKFEKWLKKTFGKSIFDVIMFVAGALGILLAVALFTLLPNQIAIWTERLIDRPLGIWKAALCGVLRIIIFIIYIVLISRMKDIRRTFEYHGAEHKSIACFEAGEELTPENAKKHSRFHPRCGTSFMFVMLFISILVSLGIRALCELVIGWNFSEMTLAATGRDLSALIYTGIGLLTLPLIVGIGFEFLMYAGKHDGPVIRALSAPGIWMQRLTTREPDEAQLAVAITALMCAMPEEFPDFPRDEYLVRDEYTNPPEKKKAKRAKEEDKETHTEKEDGAQ